MAKTKRGAKRSPKKGSKGKGRKTKRTATKRVSPMSLAARMRLGIQEGIIGDALNKDVLETTKTIGSKLADIKGEREEDKLLRTTGKFLMSTPGKKSKKGRR